MRDRFLERDQREESLLLFWRAPAGTPHNERTLAVSRISPGAPVPSEISERCFFHRAPTQSVSEGRVVSDLATAGVDSVAQTTRTQCGGVGAEERVRSSEQTLIVQLAVSRALAV